MSEIWALAFRQMRVVEIRSIVFYLFSQPDVPLFEGRNTPPILFEVGHGEKLKDCKIGAKPIPHFQSKFQSLVMVFHGVLHLGARTETHWNFHSPRDDYFNTRGISLPSSSAAARA